MNRFATLVLVGPQERELRRVGDLLDSLFHYEPGVAAVVLIDDAVQSRHLDQCFRAPPGCRLVSLPNPRRGRGTGLAGGCCAGLLTGLAWIHKNLDCHFVLKADTDALVIAPFADAIGRRFGQFPQVGMLGTHWHDPDGRPRPTASWVPTLRSFLRPVCLRGRHIQITLWGRGRRIRLALTAALQSGYRISEHCQGGANAVRGTMLQRMAAAGYLDDPLGWLHAGVFEDLMMGLYTYAVGLQCGEFNRDGEAFGVQHIGLPDRPPNLRSRGYSIVHSLKSHGTCREEDVRAYFRDVRRAAPCPSLV